MASQTKFAVAARRCRAQGKKSGAALMSCVNGLNGLEGSSKKRSGSRRRTAQQSKLGAAAHACEGKRPFKRCVAEKLAK